MELTKRKSKPIGLRKDLLFYCLILAIPVVQFCIFYIGVNFNSILLAFKKIEVVSNGTRDVKTYVWTFESIKLAWETLTTFDEGYNVILSSTVYSLIAYAAGIVIAMPLGLLFSYYIAKKFPGSGIFRVLLFLPSILSSLVMITLFSNFADYAMPEIATKFGWNYKALSFMDAKEKFGVVVAYNIWVGFGVSVLMYANAMSGISPDIIEAAELDGATGIKEFWHISLPLIYPTLSVFLITGVAGIFTNQHNIFSFFGTKVYNDTNKYPTSLGYYFYMKTLKGRSDQSVLPELSAFGLMMTIIAVPLTFGVKYLLEKFGPSED